MSWVILEGDNEVAVYNSYALADKNRKMLHKPSRFTIKEYREEEGGFVHGVRQLSQCDTGKKNKNKYTS